MAELIVQYDTWIHRVQLKAEPIVLGRAEGCDVRIPDTRLSRRHCKIWPAENGAWMVEDLGSRAGTSVDGITIHEPTPLQAGARMRIGATLVSFELPGAVPLSQSLSGAAPPVQSLFNCDASKVRLLLDTVGALYGSTDLETLLRVVVDRAILVAGGDRGALLLASPGGHLEVGVGRDASGADLAPDEALTRSLPGEVLASGRAIVLMDTEAAGQHEQTPESVLYGGLKSVLCVPLPGSEKPVGVLYVDAYRPVENFGAEDLAIFEALAVQAALAIERARLREQQVRRERDHRQRLEAENATLRAGIEPVAPIGESRPMREALDLIRRVAPSDATVCLTGETGAGKEVLARFLHQLSSRSKGPLVVVDCGAIPESLIESELFGHEKGAFTGAASPRRGLFREAEGGTVFLDEVGELPMPLQTRLLRVVQERTVQPVGGTRPVPVDVRIVCATHQDLSQKVAEGKFRQDLYYRIAVLTIPIPSLRDRGDDLLLLARSFLVRCAGTYGVGVTGFTHEAVEALQSHTWPGNVRELEHRVQRAVLLANPPFVTRRDLGLADERSQTSGALPEAELPILPLPEARAEATTRFERAYLEEVLQRCDGNIPRAALLAGVSPQLLRRLVQRHGIDQKRFMA